MMNGKNAVWLVGIAALMAGCQTAADDPLQSFPLQTPHSFSASVQFSQTGKANMTLSGPHDVLLPDETTFPAYALNVTFISRNHPGSTGWFVWYLDADMRIVAIERGCEVVIGGCEQYIEWDWRQTGHIGPAGLGYPGLAARNELTSFGNHYFIPHPWEASSLPNGTLQLIVKGGHPLGPNSHAVYFYPPNRMLPDGPEYRVIEYTAGPALTGAQRLSFPKGETDAPWTGAMFSGENDSAFTVGVSHKQILDFAFPGFDAATSCVTDYDLAVYRNSTNPSPWPATSVPDVAPRETGLATVFALLPDEFRWVQVKIMWDPVRNEATMENVDSDTVEPPHFSCQDIKDSPFAQSTPDEAVEFAKSRLSQAGRLNRFQQRVPDERLVDGSQPWYEWRMEFMPTWVDDGYFGLYEYYTMTLDPSDPPRLLSTKAHPNDY